MQEYEIESVEPIEKSQLPGKYVYRITLVFMGARSVYTTHQCNMDAAVAEAKNTKERLDKYCTAGGKGRSW